MKFCTALALFAGFSTAASILTPDSVIAALKGREVSRPHGYSGGTILESAPVPENAPADYTTTTTTLAKRDSRPLNGRRDSSRQARGPITAQDFYECATTGNPPKASDCNVVIDNVIATDQLLVIAPGACLLFQYGTCWGFFCSLCQRLGTDTDFIGAQLGTAQTLCVSGGAAGTVVGEDAPQWEAGFIRANGQLPNYAGELC